MDAYPGSACEIVVSMAGYLDNFSGKNVLLFPRHIVGIEREL